MSKSGLRAAMKAKAAAANDDTVADELAILDQPATLRVAPEPDASPQVPEGGPVDEGNREESDSTTEPPESSTTGEGSGDALPAVDPHVDPEPDVEIEPSLDPDPIETPATDPEADISPTQTAQVRASGLVTPAQATVEPSTVEPAKKKAASRTNPAADAKELQTSHLERVMRTGRDQRRYVSDFLPPRTGRGTNVRLPIHLQDVLDEYCDREAPMTALIAAVLDGYFRDIGALPPLATGKHAPVQEFFDKMRKEQRRTYDY